MRVLVTGGAGFIGSHVVDELTAADYEVRVLDCLHPGAHAGRPSYLRDDVDYRFADLADRDAVAEAVAGVDAVSHQASMVGLGVDFADIDAYVRDNDLGTAHLLRALHDAKLAVPLVLGSSMVVYGEGRYRCPEHGLVRPGPRRREQLERGEYEPRCPECECALTAEPVPEDAPVDPRNVYAATKLHQEHLVASFGREYDARVVALRYHNVYGPRMPSDTPYAGVASIFRSALAAGRSPRLYEDGRQRRDFVHVRDVARANRLALEHTDASATLNVASGEPHTVLEMAHALASGFGSGAPAPEVVGGYRLGDVRHVFAATERAERVLGFRAEVSFSDGMAELVRADGRPPAGGGRAADASSAT
jgi:dTDP-L-rhamnose 4-epimerase